ncbi:MAG: hypothetical protein ACI9VM_000864 [Candidatus Azotimanducaceae bacterium]|jgi:hypothetical protein
MKKTLIISIGIICILVAAAVWIYLLFFGAPEQSDDVFTNLGIGGGDASVQVPTNQGEDASTEDTVTPIAASKDALRQLTLKPVAGFGFVGSSSDLIRYAERGTGHVFEINVANGTEKRISGTTIPRVVDAVFEESGTSVVLIAENGYQRDIVAGYINEEENTIDLINLPTNSFDPKFTSDSVLRYAVVTDSGTDGFELDINANTPSKLFSIPLRDATFIWSEETYAYNKPSAVLQGSLYHIDQSTLTPKTSGAFGFVGGVNDAYYFSSAIVKGESKSYATARATEARTELAVMFMPEKCVPDKTTTNLLWCASQLSLPDALFIDNWYKGAVQSEDFLWLVDIENGVAELLSDFLDESGRLIDVNKIEIDQSGTSPIFRNKIDNTLWLYDTEA